MVDYFGKLNLDDLPDRSQILLWEKEARKSYSVKCGRSFDRFQMEYVNTRILEYQQSKRGEKSND